MANQPDPSILETDPRFPSGPWTGFFLQKAIPGKHRMELRLTFLGGVLTGEGRDVVGPFLIRGHYEIDTGKCRWHKRYLGRHDVFYSGFNEGKGIWGTWEISANQNHGVGLRGGFHIWPEGLHDPTLNVLVEQADIPAPSEYAGVS